MSQLALDLTAPPESWTTPYGDAIPAGALTACYTYRDSGLPDRTVRWQASHLATPSEGADRLMNSFSVSSTQRTRDGDTVTYRHAHGGVTVVTFKEAP